MNEKQIQQYMETAVDLILEGIDIELLVGMNLTIALGNNPKNHPAYDKLKYLFTQNNGESMHPETYDAFCNYVFATTLRIKGKQNK